jgi:hypothetical protein
VPDPRSAGCWIATLTNVNPEAAVMMVVVVVMMVMMIVTPRDNAVIAVVMVVVMMVMVVILRDLFSTLRLCRGDPRVIYLQRIQCIGNWLQKVAIAGRWRFFV